MTIPEIPGHLAEIQHFWCPMLGQPVRFGYCARAAEGRPCPRISQCWASHKSVGALARALGSCTTPGPGRIERLLKAIGNHEQTSGGSGQQGSGRGA